jgi:hypothetical protein
MMELAHGELTTLAIVLVIGGVIMVPVIGITLRQTVPPILEAHARARVIGAYGSNVVMEHDRIESGVERRGVRTGAAMEVRRVGESAALRSPA